MSHDTLVALANVLRGVSVALFICVLAQVTYIFYHYGAVLRMERVMGAPRSGLLPKHVLMLGFVTVAALSECVAHNIGRIGQEPDFFAFWNPFILIVAGLGLNQVMKFEYLRYKFSKGKRADLIDP